MRHRVREVRLGESPLAWLGAELTEEGVGGWKRVENVGVFKPAGEAFPVTRGRWVGAQVGLFSVGARTRTQRSYLEADYFNVTAPGVGPY